MVDFLPVNHLEKRGKKHRVYPELLTVYCALDSFQNFIVVCLALHHFLYLALVALPLQFLTFLNDGTDIIGFNAANQRLYLVCLRYQLRVFKVILLFDIVQIGQLLDLFDELRVMLQLGLPLVQVHLLQYFEQVGVEAEVALVPARAVVLQYLLLVLHRICISLINNQI